MKFIAWKLFKCPTEKDGETVHKNKKKMRETRHKNKTKKCEKYIRPAGFEPAT